MSLMSVRKITYRLKLQDTTLMWLPFDRFTTVSTQLEAEARNYCKNMSDTTEKFEAILHHVKIAGMSIMI